MNCFQCQLHNLGNKFINLLIIFYIHTWTTDICRIMKGKRQYNQTSDPIKVLAKQQFIKHRKFSEIVIEY
ncbi:hypothetical protein QE152_g322 [Popillia japonica]|uniref:Uncharacterized protein n=1 Tax=Popillia japonica TaxID=7064 RepID=A0AAW1NKN1_POPJA